MTEHPENEERLETAEEIAAMAGPSARGPFASSKKLEGARAIARTLAVAQNNVALYPVSHPLVVQSMQEFADAVAAIMEMGFEEVTINIYKGTLFIENQVLPEESVTHRKLIEDLLDRGISALTISFGFTHTDAAALVQMLNATDVTTIEQAQAFLDKLGASNMALAETTDLEDEVQEAEKRENKARGREVYDNGTNLMHDVETQA
ncbi:MAG: hypothetical protein JXA57_16590, partial [Armatimonadetes bacterium]|nr:hypothetical protein [Armatimonadota bacterium]